jgi:hypothetical protein
MKGSQFRVSALSPYTLRAALEAQYAEYSVPFSLSQHSTGLVIWDRRWAILGQILRRLSMQAQAGKLGAIARRL